MMSLAGKKIVLGVSGGIAAYKAPDLVRRLRERGADSGKEIRHDLLVAQGREGPAPVRHVVVLGEGDERFREHAQFLGFRNGGFNGMVGEQRDRQVFHGRLAMGHHAAQPSP